MARRLAQALTEIALAGSGQKNETAVPPRIDLYRCHIATRRNVIARPSATKIGAKPDIAIVVQPFSSTPEAL